MRRLLFWFVAALLPLVEISTASGNMVIANKKIVSLNFPSDGGKWTDVILSNFKETLFNTNLPVEFTDISWTEGQEEQRTVERILACKPDLVFFPDDLLYLRFAKLLRERSPLTPVVFVAFYLSANEVTLVDNQGGIFCDPPLRNLVLQARKVAPIQKVGVIGGPFASKIWDKIKAELTAVEVDVVLQKTSDWEEYASIAKEFGKTKDAVWLLAPFGVVAKDGSRVENHQMNGLIDSIKKISFGYGKIAYYDRSFSMNIDPVDLGKDAANVASKYFKGEGLRVENLAQFPVQVSRSNLEKLGLAYSQF